MNKLDIKGKENINKGRRKQEEATKTGDGLKCIDGKEDELVGRIQKKFSKGEDEVLERIDKAESN